MSLSPTSMCLSSSLSNVGYLSSLMKGLLRPEVSVRIPGIDAPLPSMNSPSSSLQGQKPDVITVISVEFLCGIRTQCGGVPVIGENTDCRWVVGAVRHIKRPYLGHEIQEEPSHFLLELRKPSITEHWGELLHKYRANILLRSFLNLGYKSIFPILTTHSAMN